jgi:hypothetical protein
MRTHRRPLFVSLAIIALILTSSLFFRSSAEPSFFTSDCAGCHSNDTPTCNGCHHHRGTIHATADQASYFPGGLVTVRLTGGTQHGWIRGLLYDQNGTQVDIRTGPTGTGDDSQGNPVVFPVTLQAPAPGAPGDYTWQAAWFGNNNGAGHEETRTPVTIHVAADSAVPDEASDIARLFSISPNPLRDWSTLRFHAAPQGERVSLAILDPSGRRVRLLWNASVSAGDQEFFWDARDDAGRALPSGTYFAMLVGKSGRAVRALHVIR